MKDWWPALGFWVAVMAIWFTVMGFHLWRVVRRRPVLKTREKLDD